MLHNRFHEPFQIRKSLVISQCLLHRLSPKKENSTDSVFYFVDVAYIQHTKVRAEPPFSHYQLRMNRNNFMLISVAFSFIFPCEKLTNPRIVMFVVSFTMTITFLWYLLHLRSLLRRSWLFTKLLFTTFCVNCKYSSDYCENSLLSLPS